MVIVGLPDASLKELEERVLSAIRTLECDVTDKKIVVSLSPSEQKKNGPSFDLAMAIGVLKEAGELKERIPEEAVFIGALLVIYSDIFTIKGAASPTIARIGIFDFRISFKLFKLIVPINCKVNTSDFRFSKNFRISE